MDEKRRFSSLHASYLPIQVLKTSLLSTRFFFRLKPKQYKKCQYSWLFNKNIRKLIKNKVNIYDQQLNFWLNNWRLHNWRSRKPQLLILVWNPFLEPFLPKENPSLFFKLGFWYSIFVSIFLSCHRDLIWRSMSYASSMSWNMYKQNLIFWQNICFVHGLRKLNYNFRWRGEQRVY